MSKDKANGIDDFQPDEKEVEIIEKIASKLKGKSEEEVFVEIVVPGKLVNIVAN